jgi:hypothetical protein
MKEEEDIIDLRKFESRAVEKVFLEYNGPVNSIKEDDCKFCGGTCPEVMDSKYPWYHKDYDLICADFIEEELNVFKLLINKDKNERINSRQCQLTW